MAGQITRRAAVERIGMAAGAALLSGCRTLSGTGTGGVCAPPGAGGVDWVLPDVGYSVDYGVTDGLPQFAARRLESAAALPGPPRAMLIYYPSAGLLDQPRPMLRPCIGRFPLVIFLHGDSGSIPRAGYHEKWRRICSTIASCGYVVAAPVHTALPTASDAALAAVARDVAWLRGEWSGSPWLDARTGSTSFIGHSWGAVLAARAAAELPASAFASLGGGFTADPESIERVKALSVPAFYAFLTGDSEGSAAENLEGLWNQMTGPRWRAVYAGRHFDYLDPADAAPEPRGAVCNHFPQAMADLVTLFLGHNVMSRTPIGLDLARPSLAPTAAQYPYAFGHLYALEMFERTRGCRLDLAWQTPTGAGSRRLGLA